MSITQAQLSEQNHTLLFLILVPVPGGRGDFGGPNLGWAQLVLPTSGPITHGRELR